MMEYLSTLNQVQQDAVKQVNGPILVIAGPGSGKTRVLTYRIAYMIQQGIDPFNILALTFTNKAAREMKARIESVAGIEARNLAMGTFHSVFAKILRVEGHRIGYPSNFTIYDTDDSKSLIKKIVKELNLNENLYKPNVVYNRISSAKNALISAEKYTEASFLKAEDEAAGRPRMGEVYKEYARRCFQSGAMDFDDLLLKMFHLLDNYPEVLYKFQQKFKYILIDEFQDTNHAQFQIVKMLGDMYENICVVGDDAQSIYSFRGAEIQNILDFEQLYPDLKVFKLEQNYRSTKHIVGVANEIIARNRNQLAKTIWTDNSEGHKIKILRCASDNEEGKKVADTIFEEKMGNHLKNDEFCILYRTNAQSRAFEESLRRLNIAYRVYGGLSFYQRKEVKDMLAYLRVIINPNDEEAFRRIINYPVRGIGQTTIDRITVAANEQQCTLWQIIQNPETLPINRGTAQKIQDFVMMIRSFQTMIEVKNAYDLAHYVAKSTALMGTLYQDKSIEGLSRYENFQGLLNSIKEFTTTQAESEDEAIPEDKSLGSYLQEVSLITDIDKDDDDIERVKLMSIHAAKGLEFPVVFVVGMEENLFPSMLSTNSRQDLEEERRLFYVAVTRAERKLMLSYATTRYKYGNLQYCDPSRFLDEIPGLYLESPIPSGSPAFNRPSFSEARIIPSSDTTHQNSGFSSLKKTGKFNLSPSQIPLRNSGTMQEPQSIPEDFVAANPAEIREGMEVEHLKFGKGKVVSVEGKPGSQVSNIFFKRVGQKRIMLKFAKLRIIGG